MNYEINKFTVSEVNGFVKRIISSEEVFYGINVEGEISNFKYHSSGHIYFTLKDEKSSINCIVFKEQVSKLMFIPKNGMVVVVYGDVNVYERYGRYQIYVINMQKFEEKGKLQQKLEALKQKLFSEGCFNLKEKKDIPKFPKTIGVIAAKGGAAIEDIIKIVERRFPLAKLKIYYALMQGKRARYSICKAISSAEKGCLDVLILARGGGSSEDLEVFNDEQVIRTVLKFKKPVVSAIGHETDWSILDLICDFRASTPSVAAEIVCPDILNLKKKIDEYSFLIKKTVLTYLDEYFLRLQFLKKNLMFNSPLKYLEYILNKVQFYKKRLINLILKKYDYYINFIENKMLALRLLNPEKFYDKGYRLILTENERVVKSFDDIKLQENLNIFLKDGILRVKIIEKIVK